MLVNKGVYKYDSITTALYLETESENAYKIGSAVISIGLNTIYDEIIATCSGSFDDEDAVLWNDTCAVVSIHTSGGAVTMDGAGCNTYQNQTSVKRQIPIPDTIMILMLSEVRMFLSVPMPKSLCCGA